MWWTRYACICQHYCNFPLPWMEWVMAWGYVTVCEAGKTSLVGFCFGASAAERISLCGGNRQLTECAHSCQVALIGSSPAPLLPLFLSPEQIGATAADKIQTNWSSLCRKLAYTNSGTRMHPISLKTTHGMEIPCVAISVSRGEATFRNVLLLTECRSWAQAWLCMFCVPCFGNRTRFRSQNLQTKAKLW